LSAQSSGNDAVSRAVDAINERRFSDAISNLQAAINSARNIVDMRQRNDVLATLHFYSAVAFLELNDEESTIAELRRYVELRNPDERVDEEKYSHRFVELYRQVLSTPRVEVGTPYDRIYPMPETVAATFTETPVRFWDRSSEFTLLATPGEKNQWQTLTSDDARRDFIATFWAVRDLRPETAENEFRLELQRRIAYADRVFGTSTQRGSLTDRGRVFALLGVPDAIEIKHDLAAETGNLKLAPAALSSSVKREVTFDFLNNDGPAQLTNGLRGFPGYRFSRKGAGVHKEQWKADAGRNGPDDAAFGTRPGSTAAGARDREVGTTGTTRSDR
jgi:GWxTD domain-containing protein